MTAYLYLLLNWNSPKLACEGKGDEWLVNMDPELLVSVENQHHSLQNRSPLNEILPLT